MSVCVKEITTTNSSISTWIQLKAGIRTQLENCKLDRRTGGIVRHERYSELIMTCTSLL